MTKRVTGKVSAALVKMVADELKEVTRRHEADDGKHKKGDFVYSATDRMRVLDRAIKVEQLKLGAGADEWGSAFSKDAKDEE